MSTVVINGRAVAKCVAATGKVVKGAAVGVGLTAKGLWWLGKKALSQLRRLEKELRAASAQTADSRYVTPAQAREQYQKHVRQAQELVQQHSVFKGHDEAVVKYLALSSNPMSRFLTEKQWDNIATTPESFKTDNLLEQAIKNFQKANAQVVTQSIVATAAEVGFTAERSKREKGGKSKLVLENPEDGQSLRVVVEEAEEGASINLDIPGTNPNCGQVMNRILAGLAEREIFLDNITKQSHFLPNGVLSSVWEDEKEPCTAESKPAEKAEVKEQEQHWQPATNCAKVTVR